MRKWSDDIQMATESPMKIFWRARIALNLNKLLQDLKMPENHSEKGMSSNGQNGEKIEMV